MNNYLFVACHRNHFLCKIQTISHYITCLLTKESFAFSTKKFVLSFFNISILLLFNNLWHIVHQGLWLIINPYQYLYISWGAVHSSKGTLFNWMWMSYRPSLNKSPDHFATCRNTHIQGEQRFDQNISYSSIETAWAIHSFLMSNIS